MKNFFILFYLILVSISAYSQEQFYEKINSKELKGGNYSLIVTKNKRIITSTKKETYISDNLGNKWKKVYDISFRNLCLNNDTIFATKGESDSLYFSANNGLNWEFKTIISKNKFHFSPKNELWTLHKGKFIVSENYKNRDTTRFETKHNLPLSDTKSKNYILCNYNEKKNCYFWEYVENRRNGDNFRYLPSANLLLNGDTIYQISENNKRVKYVQIPDIKKDTIPKIDFLIYEDNEIYVKKSSSKKWLKLKDTIPIEYLYIRSKEYKRFCIFVYNNTIRFLRKNNKEVACKEFDSNFQFQDILFTDSLIFLSTWGNGILRSSDNGKTWNKCNNGLKKRHFTSNFICIDNRILVSINYGIAYSDDFGEKWNIVDTEEIASFIYNKNTLYAGTDEGIIFSRDKGET